MTLWSGRVETSVAREVEELLRADDAELFYYDVEGSLDGLAWEPGHEDVHTMIEVGLGDVGRKIHAGRSRNDQVATAFRLYVTDASTEAVETIERFART